MKLGVFDSGIGGEAVALALADYFPDATITTVNDHEHLPYGDRTIEDIRHLTDTAIQPLLGSGAIVLACNSATAAAIDWLRTTYPNQKFIGLEPMIKPAARQTKTGVIAVCATPATLASKRYQALKRTHASSITVIEPDCSLWAEMIENNAMNEQLLSSQITDLLNQSVDVIVLGCTHYHWIKQDIIQLTGGHAAVIDPSDAICRRVDDLIADAPLPQ